MNKRTAFLIGAALVLAAVYLFAFTDWMAPKKIQIMWRDVPGRGGRGSGSTLAFYLDAKYTLTSVKVFSTDEARTNKYPRALWHLVSETNSTPIEEFAYGSLIGGMKPDIPHSEPEPLLPNAPYKIIIEAGKKLKGELTFNPRGKTEAAN
jgi:hypothetical protein